MLISGKYEKVSIFLEWKGERGQPQENRLEILSPKPSDTSINVVNSFSTALDTIYLADCVLTRAHWVICILKVVWENILGVKCLIITGSRSINIMALSITNSYMYGSSASAKLDNSYVLKVRNEDVCSYPPASTASISFAPYQSVSVAPHKTYLRRSEYLLFPSASAGRKNFSSEGTVEPSSA